MLRALIITGVLLASGIANAISFSNNTPLSAELKNKMTAIVAEKCNVAGLLVVESRTLVNSEDVDGQTVDKYFTTLAVLTPANDVYASIELLAQVSANETSISILRSPLCRR
ncbi:MAG: hypothetical protein ACLGGX_12515 [Bdellovibrionia bacterium]